MVGMPAVCKTKKDWKNATDYAIANNTGKDQLYNRLEQLKNNHYKNVLKKESMDKPAEDQTPEDYEAVGDPAAEKYKLGFTDGEIEKLQKELK